MPVPVPPGASLNRVPGIAHPMHCPNDPIRLGFVRDPVRRSRDTPSRFYGRNCCRRERRLLPISTPPKVLVNGTTYDDVERPRGQR